MSSKQGNMHNPIHTVASSRFGIVLWKWVAVCETDRKNMSRLNDLARYIHAYIHVAYTTSKMDPAPSPWSL